MTTFRSDNTPPDTQASGFDATREVQTKAGPVVIFGGNDSVMEGHCNDRHRPQKWDRQTGKNLGDDNGYLPADPSLDLVNVPVPLPAAAPTGGEGDASDAYKGLRGEIGMALFKSDFAAEKAPAKIERVLNAVKDWISRSSLPDAGGGTQGALTSEDEAFSCAPQYAVELAYMLGDAEAFAHEHSEDFEIGRLLSEYLRGDLSPADVRKELKEWRDEKATALLHQTEARDDEVR